MSKPIKPAYELVKAAEFSGLGGWRVESFGPEGECYIAHFWGPGCEERAQEYADFKNGVRKPAKLMVMPKKEENPE